MPDYGSKVTEKTIAAMVRRLQAVYRQAKAELERKLAGFVATHKRLDAEKRALVKAGKMTMDEYRRWVRGQIFTGTQWTRKIDQSIKTIQNANQQAVRAITEGRLDVFAENYNHAAYELEKGLKGAISFNIYNTESVVRLIREKPQMLPVWKPDEPKDYTWNRQKVENAITQGIIQGESIEKITKRLIDTLCTQNENKMRTFARTAMTGAQNAGRQVQMEDAEKKGVNIKKRWVATLDERTRDTHQRLDGQEVPVDDVFTIDKYKIRFPGDPTAAPEMVYNCRCSIIQIYQGVKRKSRRRAYDEPDETGRRDSYIVEDMTYLEWKEWKKKNGKR